MLKSGIYKITNSINDKIYVGSSIDCTKRLRNHLYYLKRGNHKNIILQNFTNKYGLDCLTLEIIEYCDINSLIEREQYYIDNLNSRFNICKIAGNTLGKSCSQETKDKIRYILSYKVYQYDLNGVFIRSWDDSREASEYLKCDRRGINKCCKGWFKSFMGYMWSYIYEEKLNPYIDTSLKQICQYDKSFKLIKEFKSIINASKELNISRTLLSRICANSKGIASGYYFGYKSTSIDILISNNSKKEIYVFSKNKELIFSSNDVDIICKKFNLKRGSLSRSLNSQKGILYKQLLFSYEKDFK